MSVGLSTNANLLAIKVFNIELVGVNARTGKKVLFTVALFALVYAVRWVALRFVRSLVEERPDRAGFWSRQGIRLVALTAFLLGLISIWINPGTDITTGLGLISAGLAFALQQLITAFAGYFVILRGDTYNVGDRISFGGVRGDVIRLGFIKTTIMEMGEPPAMDDTDPAVWVKSRQYTGRIVTVSNGTIFNEPVFNFTRDFPYIWEEMVVPITYDADRSEAERILLAAATAHSVPESQMSTEALEEMKDRYAVGSADLTPMVFMRITDNWLELSLRFVVPAVGVRHIKDHMTRDILEALDSASIGIASATYDIVGLPPLEVHSGPDTDSA